MSFGNIYPENISSATLGFMNLIACRCPLSFSDYMALALYHPQHGYYAKAPNQIGKSGDFFTSVSAGPLFGKILSHYIANWWQKNGEPAAWRIIEPGANNAALSIDILTEIKDHFPSAFIGLEYITVDPSPVPQNFQKEKLQQFTTQARALSNIAELEETPLPSFVIANEILDALPFQLVQFSKGQWHEIWVDQNFAKILKPIPTPVILANEKFPENYRTEIRNNFGAFIEPFQKAMTHGKMLFFDYGFAAIDYYHPSRTTGTLRVFKNHQATENPYENPGDCDITAHVDFTTFAKQAINLGLQIKCFEPQEFFLTRNAVALLEEISTDPKMVRNFQTLTHPHHLGHKFHVIELSANESETHDCTVLSRLNI
jgi:SAM-dependent MidA family methyltransferase